jgi:hypothetical protein
VSTLTIEQTRTAVGARREAEYEAYHEWLESLRRDEVTDAAERVRAPQQTTMEFILTPDGLVNDLGQSLRPIIEDGIIHAERMALTNPDWRVELERRRIELEEYDIMETLAAEGPGAGALVSRWMIPDSVRNGNSSLPGYNRERLKMFNRYAIPTESGLIIAYQSLDGSNYEGVRAMDEALGFELPEDAGSEDIARNRRFVPIVSSLEWLMDNQRAAYDDSLAEQLGGEWYAGRPPIDVREVTEYVNTQTDLVDAHMDIVHKIFALTKDRDERMRMLEPHRYNLAAAIDTRLHNPDAEVTSLQEAGDAARSAGMDFDGDCPTGTTALEQAGQLGFAAKKWGSCPHCRAYVEFDPCDPECYECGATKHHGPTRKIGARAVAQVQKAKNPAKQRYATNVRTMAGNAGRRRTAEAQMVKGRAIRYESRLVVGGTKEVLVDAVTGLEVDL